MLSSTCLTAELTLRIARALARGPMRFNEIERTVEASCPPVLSKYLKRMQRDGLIERRVVSLGPPAHTAYALTKLGADLARPATALIEWAERNAPYVEAARERSAAVAQA